jgi:membrane-associated PAP2 superfamily phosphatase
MSEDGEKISLFRFSLSFLLSTVFILTFDYIQLRNGSAQLTSDQSLQNLGWNIKIPNWLQKTISFSKLVTGKLLEILAINSNTTFRSATSRKMQLRFFDCTQLCRKMLLRFFDGTHSYV